MVTKLSPGALVYGAADLFVQSHWGTLASVPCSEVLVNLWHRGAKMLEATLAVMASQELIAFTCVDAKKLLVLHTTEVHVHLTGCSASNLPQSGLSGWLARSITTHDGGKVYDIVRAAYGRNSLSPVGLLEEMAVQELVSQGFYQQIEQEVGGITGMMRKAVHAAPKQAAVTVPNCACFAALREDAVYLREMLAAVRSSEPHLWEALEKNLNSAIESRVERINASVGIDSVGY